MTDPGKFKAIGLPIMLIVTYALTVLMTHQRLIRAFHASRAELGTFALFLGSMTASLLSMLLYFSAAWPYALICTLLCYLTALIIGSSDRAQHSRVLFGAVAIWFALLIGIPSNVSAGIISTAAHDSCNAYYGEKSDAMCKEGWLDFVEILATGLISVTFLTLMNLMASAVDSSAQAEPSYHAVDDNPRDFAPQGRGQVPATPKGEYQPM